LSGQRQDNLPVEERLGQKDHVEEVRAAELSRQLLQQRRNNLLAVPSTFLSENFPADAVSNGPGEQDHAGVDRLGDVGAAGL